MAFELRQAPGSSAAPLVGTRRVGRSRALASALAGIALAVAIWGGRLELPHGSVASPGAGGVTASLTRAAAARQARQPTVGARSSTQRCARDEPARQRARRDALAACRLGHGG